MIYKSVIDAGAGFVMDKTTVLYLRCSTRKQELEVQEQELRAVAKRAGWEIGAVYSDYAISGAKGREQRKGLDEMLNACSRREIARVMVYDISRLGRSLTSLVATLDVLKSSGASFYSHLQNLDTSTAAGTALFGMISVFSEFERSIIRDRVVSGMTAARARGVRFGRRAIDAVTVKKIRTMREKGMSQAAIANKVGLAQQSVSRVLRG